MKVPYFLLIVSLVTATMLHVSIVQHPREKLDLLESGKAVTLLQVEAHCLKQVKVVFKHGHGKMKLELIRRTLNATDT